MALFAMIHTRASSGNTTLAVNSFLEKGSLRTGERLIVLDNDGSLPVDSLPKESIEFLRNESPRTFAENNNQLIKMALREGSDLFLLNSDLIFSRGWSESLRIDRPIILSPLINHSQESDAICDVHKQQSDDLLKVLTLPYRCIKLPLKVMQKIGKFDESYGDLGGAEHDYSLRALLAGFEICYSLGALIQHLGAQNDKRDHLLNDIFLKKWGDKLYQLIILENFSVIDESQEVRESMNQRNMQEVVTKLLGSLKPEIYI